MRSSGLLVSGFGAGGGVDVIDSKTATATDDLGAVLKPLSVKTFETLRRNHIDESPVGHFEES